MDDIQAVRDIRADEERYPDDLEFDNERWEQVKTELHDDLGRVISETSLFVLGSYNDNEAKRLEAVCSRFEDHGYPYLMEDIVELWEFWTTKFKILVSRSDYIVGVYEHSDGGHEWEAGYIDQKKYRDRTYVFKREYPSKELEYENYDGMFTHYLQSMDRIGHFWDWRIPDDAGSVEESTEELLTAVDALIDTKIDS